jgi:hemoglobin-like flavoprotein
LSQLPHHPPINHVNDTKETPMNATQVQLVQSSFEQVKPIAPIAAKIFYGHLFEIDPTLKNLFNGDMVRQGAMLMSMLGKAVSGLSKPETIVPTVKLLGARHVGYGVRDHHYHAVGVALLWTLEQGLGNAFTEDVKQAWSAAYQLLASVMQEGARETAVPAAA